MQAVETNRSHANKKYLEIGGFDACVSTTVEVKMKIRSITYFCNPKYPLNEKILQKAGKFLAEAKSAYETAGYEVQTTRLATIPFPKLLSSYDFSRSKATKVVTT